MLWTYNPLTGNFLNLRSFGFIVYHCVDEIKAQPGMPVEILESAEKELVQNADLTFVTSLTLLESRKNGVMRFITFQMLQILNISLKLAVRI
jgi:hypothetical protein